MIRTCAYDTDCQRIPAPFHALCESHEAIVLSSAFGPVSWTERAALGVLPPMVDLPLGSAPGAEPHAAIPDAVARLGSRRGAVAPRAA